MGWKVCLRCKGKTLLGVVNKLLKNKKFVEITQQCCSLLPQVNFPTSTLLKVMHTDSYGCASSPSLYGQTDLARVLLPRGNFSKRFPQLIIVLGSHNFTRSLTPFQHSEFTAEHLQADETHVKLRGSSHITYVSAYLGNCIDSIYIIG